MRIACIICTVIILFYAVLLAVKNLPIKPPFNNHLCCMLYTSTEIQSGLCHGVQL